MNPPDDWTIAAQWESYRKILPEDAGPVQVRQTRCAFYSGVLAMIDLNRRLGKPEISEERFLLIIEAISEELRRFAATEVYPRACPSPADAKGPG